MKKNDPLQGIFFEQLNTESAYARQASQRRGETTRPRLVQDIATQTTRIRRPRELKNTVTMDEQIMQKLHNGQKDQSTPAQRKII